MVWLGFQQAVFEAKMTLTTRELFREGISKTVFFGLSVKWGVKMAWDEG